MASDIDELKAEIPHVLVLIALLLVLLVVATKYKVVHCSQVPGDWCNVYCTYFNGGKSKVAIVSGDSGIGNPDLLRNTISQKRMFTFVEPVPLAGMSSGQLKQYELVILEKARRITPNQAEALQEYVAQGGVLLVIGDSATQYYISDEDLTAAQMENQSRPGAVERLQNRANQPGFGVLSTEIQAKFVSAQNVTSGLTFKRLLRDHMSIQGLKDEFGFPPMPFAIVAPNPATTTIVATLTGADGKAHPAILDTKVGFRTTVFYSSFPLEATPSVTLLLNVMDYLVTC